MTTEELIPVLKALHSDPRCSPMMADWFEERGDDQLATWLRQNGVIVPEGKLLIEALWKLPARSRDLIRFAVVREAVDRMERYMRGTFHEILLHYLGYDIRNHVEMQTGDRRHLDWQTIDADGFTAGVGRNDFTYLERRNPNNVLWAMEYGLRGPYDPNWEPLPLAVQMYYGTCCRTFGEERMDGRPLEVYTDVWYGTNSGRVLVSRLRDEHVRFWL